MPGINVLSFSLPPHRDFFFRCLLLISASPTKFANSIKSIENTECVWIGVLNQYILLLDPSILNALLLFESLLLEQLNISVKFFDAAMRWLAATASKYALVISFGCDCGVSNDDVAVWVSENGLNIGNDDNTGIIGSCSWCWNDCDGCEIELNAPDCLNSNAISRRRSFSSSFSLASRSRSCRSSRRCRRRSVLELRLRLRLRLRRCRRSLLLLLLFFFDLHGKEKCIAQRKFNDKNVHRTFAMKFNMAAKLRCSQQCREILLFLFTAFFISWVRSRTGASLVFILVFTHFEFNTSGFFSKFHENIKAIFLVNFNTALNTDWETQALNCNMAIVILCQIHRNQHIHVRIRYSIAIPM